MIEGNKMTKTTKTNQTKTTKPRKSSKSSVKVWPNITKGTHLTVIEQEDGSTELIWDDEQLLKEVREALASVENE